MLTPEVFTLTIECGNEAMKSYRDISAALRRLADRLETKEPREGYIRDLNGNTVGAFEVTFTEEAGNAEA